MNQRECDRDPGAAELRSTDFERAPVALGHPSHDIEPEPGRFRSGDASSVRPRFDAGAGVAHAEPTIGMYFDPDVRTDFGVSEDIFQQGVDD